MRNLVHHVLNWPGWRSKRKLLVIESDDWGSLRMPTGTAYQNLVEQGVVDAQDPYSAFDTLEDEEDLSALFSVLSKFRDIAGNPPVITTNVIVANPDFGAIRSTGFTTYAYRPFTEDYSERDKSDSCIRAWKSGVNMGLIRPQLHGREHVNIYQWLSSLEEGNEQMRIAFESGTFAVPHYDRSAKRSNYMATYDIEGSTSASYINQSIRSGIEIFERIFSFRPLSFIAPCYVWGSDVERGLNQAGIQFIQGIYFQYIPTPGKSSYARKWHYIGERNKLGQVYLTRNSFFEPSLAGLEGEKVVENCLNRIRTAFLWGKPAIVGSHRLNYVGGISRKNREQNLRLLNMLLSEIQKSWPDVEFISSDQLGKLIVGSTGE